MATRGTRVGRAYVDLTVDGDGINEQIVNDVGEAGDGVERKGEEHGKRYGDGFDEGFFDRIRTQMFGSEFDKALSNGRRSLAREGEASGDSFVDRMKRVFNRDGDSVFKSLTRVFERKSANIGETQGENIVESLRRQLKKAQDNVESTFDEINNYRRGDSAFAKGLLRDFEDALKVSEDLERQIKRVSSVASKATVTPRVSGNGGADRDVSRLGDKVGKLFGGGSRNNFLNTFGNSLGGIINLTAKAGGAVTGLFKTFSTGFNSLQEGASLLERTGAGFSALGSKGSGALTALVSSAPAAAAAILVLVGALSIMASVAGALVGILVALSATIASALTAAILVATPLLLGMVAAGGLLTAGILSMTDAQKKFAATSFKPVLTQLKSIGQTVIKEVTPAFPKMAQNIKSAFGVIEPFASGIGRSFARAGVSLTKSFSGPGFTKFFTQLGIRLPRIITDLSSAFGDLLNGILGALTPALPYVTQFADYLADVAKRFSDFANSAKGQNEIGDFIDRAVVSLKSFWGLVKEVGGLLGDLFFNSDAQKTGNGIFDGLTGAVKGLRENIQDASEDGSFGKWLDDAKRFGDSLGETMESLTKIFDALNDSGVLEAIAGALEGIAAGMALAAPVGDKMAQAFGVVLQGALDSATRFVNSAKDSINLLKDAISAVPGVVSSMATGAVTKFYALKSGATAAIDGVRAGVSGTFENVRSIVSSKMSQARNAAVGAAGRLVTGVVSAWSTARSKTSAAYEGVRAVVASKMSQARTAASNGASRAVGAIVSAWNTAVSRTSAAFERMRSAVSGKIGDIVGLVRGLPGKAASALSNLGGTLYHSGIALLEGFGRGIIDKGRDIYNAAKSVLSKVKGLFPNSPAKEGPFSGKGWTYYSGVAITNDLARGLHSRVGAVRSAALKVLNAAKAVTPRITAASRSSSLAGTQAQLNSLSKQIGGTSYTPARRRAYNTVNAQKGVSLVRVNSLINSGRAANATLADYAKARETIAARLAAANQKLTDAVSLRDEYAKAVTAAITSFGQLTTASAKTIDGVEQDLTSDDITSNLQDRLNKIKAFQNNVAVLRSQGLSDAAYKQIVDAGVDNGSEYADALVKGGAAAVDKVNSLTSQINSLANTIGQNTSSSLYQAGVNAAQGLVDGLKARDAQLAAAASRLGSQIAVAVRRALGIKSPSTVLRDDMDYVGDGAEIGLDRQHSKVISAGTRFANAIRTSATAAVNDVNMRASVSGNPGDISGVQEATKGPAFRDLIVQTPTKDPKAVAMETVNELVARL